MTTLTMQSRQFVATGNASPNETGKTLLTLGKKLRRPTSKSISASAASIESLDDSALVELTREGKREAFKVLVERYQKRAHSVALGILGSYEDAEDIAQEAFVKAYKNLDSFRGQSSFYTWLYRIIFNLSIDLSRKASRRSEFASDKTEILDAQTRDSVGSGAYLSSTPAPDAVLRKREIREGIKKALSELSENHRAVIVLREIEGLSYAEMSDVLGCSQGTVMSRLHHARKRLQESLQAIR